MFKRMTQKDFDITQNAEVGIQIGEITELNLAEIDQVSGGCPHDQPPAPEPWEPGPVPHSTIHELAPRQERDYQVVAGGFTLQLG